MSLLNNTTKESGMNSYGEYIINAKALRNNAMVAAWIKEFQKDGLSQHPNCKNCGFPHSPHLLCNGATFGIVSVGGHRYYIDLSNVVWWVGFMQTCAPPGAFHWRDQKFFGRTSEGVEITFFTPYNNTPQRIVWKISASEWESIVGATTRS